MHHGNLKRGLGSLFLVIGLSACGGSGEPEVDALVGLQSDGVSDEGDSAVEDRNMAGLEGEAENVVPDSERLPGTHIYTTANGFDFSPELVEVEVDEPVHFHLAEGHTVLEVNFENWQKLETTPLEDGFEFGLDENFGTVSFDRPGTHYYVCQPHVEMGMRGQIIVE